MAAKKTSKAQKAKPRSRVKASPVTQRPTYAELRQQLTESLQRESATAGENVRLSKEMQDFRRQLTEALEQQSATSEILRVIANSLTDLQQVLDTVAENAARLCQANDATIARLDGNTLQRLGSAKVGPIPRSPQPPMSRGNPSGRAVLDRTTVHVHDITAEFDGEFPESRVLQQRTGTRTILCTPLLREGTPIGVITIRRTEVRPFSEKQIALLQTFSDQAVIAIENVRLFQELKESLDQQTATSEILGVIASSPTDLQPVLDAIAENAARLCEANDALINRIDGNMVERVAVYGTMPVPEMRRHLSRGYPAGRAIIDRQTIHVHDVAAELTEFPDSKTRQPITGVRTLVCTPLLREGVSIGVITVRRKEVRPFSEKQIELLKTFADQAVIAIENVRLFQELKEALQQQTATSEILGVIASSPTELQPVLDAVAENAARVCGATDATIFMQVDDARYLKVAGYGSTPGSPIGTEMPLNRYSVGGRAIVDREVIHIQDFLEVAADYSSSRAPSQGYRTMLCAPLLREGVAIGGIGIRRTEVKPFSEKQIALLRSLPTRP